MSDSSQSSKQQPHFGVTLLISFSLFNFGYIVDQTVRWSDHLYGFMNGVLHAMVFGIAWCIYILPWSLLIYALYRWRKWRRFRTTWVLAPAVLILIMSVGSLIIHPPSPSNRFKSFAKIELPGNIQNLSCQFSGGGITDYNDTYYFVTTPDEVDRIIAELQLTEDVHIERDGLAHMPLSPFTDHPDLSAWKGVKKYTGWDDDQHWFYYLITDSSRTKVYMLVGCI